MASQKVTTPESLILIKSSDVHITTSSLCEAGFTKVTVEFFSPMDTSDVVMTTFLACIYFITKITVESLTMMWLERPRRDLKVVSQKSQLNLSP